MMNRTSLCESHPEYFFLDPAEPDALENYMRRSGVLSTTEQVHSVTRAGDGNMNCTVRVATSHRSLVVKQSRPWVEKYPQFEAPWDRACREIDFYELIQPHPEVRDAMPELRFVDRSMRFLVLEDLGPGADYTDLYRGAMLEQSAADSLAGYLTALHGAFDGPPPGRSLPNREMRGLNHAHIFVIPLDAHNGLDLDAWTPGLGDAARELYADAAYVTAVRQLGEVYLADGPRLVHGDFFPGSFLRSASGPKVIDPEFAFFGRPEFDSGVLLAHLFLARQTPELRARFLRRYQPPPGTDLATMCRFAGAEIMRRILGYARLPTAHSLGEVRALLDCSRELLLSPRMELLER